jgi:hypothetical protein
MPVFTRTMIENHSVDLRQFIDFRQSTLPNGMRLVEAYNAAGLSFTLLPDRGLDIWTAHYKGLPLTWVAQGSPFPPDFGLLWLQQFNGGLMTTCGLLHVGPPEHDTDSGEFRDLHGRYSRLRASDLSVTGGWIDETNYTLSLSGVVCEQRLFQEQLRLARTVSLPLAETAFSITDTITNLGDHPAPLMLLYHINVGYPLVSAGAELVVSSQAYPREAIARAGFDRWMHYDGPQTGYAEQVFFHHLRTSGSIAQAALLQPDWGMKVAWRADELPYLTQWKNTRQGIYVSGIEPGNCIPEGQNSARTSGRLRLIQPGESLRFGFTLSLLDGVEAVQRCRTEIAADARGSLISDCHLSDFAL